MWFGLLSKIYDNGRINKITVGSYAGAKRLEFDFAAGTILFPTTRPLAPIVPEGVPPVTTDEDIEDYFVNYIMDGHNLNEDEHYRYSTWITGGLYTMPEISYKFHPVDSWFQGNRHTIINVPNQVGWILDHYKKKGFGNNHCYIQVGYPESNIAYDIPYETEADRQTSPCLRGIDTKVVKDEGVYKLCFHVYFRSWDLYAAWPQNLGGITMLMEYMAGELGIEVGTLSFSSMKLHCYDFQIEAVEARLNKDQKGW